MMVEAVNPSWLLPTSILDMYEVFEHLNMLWMGIWVHLYIVIPVEVGAKFWTIGVRRSPNDVVVSWLRLQTPADCIPHPYWIYIKCLSTYISYAVDGHIVAITMICILVHPCYLFTLAKLVQVLVIWASAATMKWWHEPPLNASHIHNG